MNEESLAKVYGRNLPISTKHSVEICSFIRGKNLQKAKNLLQKVIEKKLAIPFKRFNKNIGHKRGIASGRYPQKAVSYIIKLLNSVEANAQNKGLDANSLFIEKIVANTASVPWHSGRKRKRKMKRTHIEIIVKEKSK